MQFQLRKIGHVVLNVTDLDRAVGFYTGVLGLEVSDRYPDSMMPGGMVFLRLNPDHHGVALVGGASKSERTSLNHFAFEVGSVDEVFRAREKGRGAPLRGTAPRGLSDRDRVPGSGRQQPRDLLEHRPDRDRGHRATRQRVAAGQDAGRRRGEPGEEADTAAA
jgi:catechol 2,3-dioxygenase-like lactoylglutathione lyase family enzyme